MNHFTPFGAQVDPPSAPPEPAIRPDFRDLILLWMVASSLAVGSFGALAIQTARAAQAYQHHATIDDRASTWRPAP